MRPLRSRASMMTTRVDKHAQRHAGHPAAGTWTSAASGSSIGFKSLQEQIDTTTSGGKLVFHVFGALAEFKRDLIRERTQAGLTAARARGRRGGRPKAAALNTPRKVQIAQRLYADKSNAIADICRTLRISRATLYRYIKSVSHVDDR